MEIYVVKEGDTIDRIAALYGVSPLYLAWANQIEAPYPWLSARLFLSLTRAGPEDAPGTASCAVPGAGSGWEAMRIPGLTAGC